MSGADTGILVGVVIGGIWGAAGANGLPNRWRATGVALSLAITAGLIAAMFLVPRHGPATGTFRGGVYGVAVALEIVAILTAAAVLQRKRRRDLIAPAVGLIVGLHFLGLWAATGLIRFAWLALAMSGLCACALLIPTRGNGYAARLAISGIGCALVLWLAGAISLLD
jgi:hypothetical protein